MSGTLANEMDHTALKHIDAALILEQIQQYSLGKPEDIANKRAPYTPMEKTLQWLWAELLHVDAASIGVDDSFFSKGGDDIKAIRLTTLARSAGINLIPANIFKYPVLRDMARAVTSKDKKDRAAAAKRAPERKDKVYESMMGGKQEASAKVGRSFVLTAYQEALLEMNGGAQTLLLPSDSPTTVQKLVRAVESLVQQHPMLRARFSRDEEGEWSQHISKELTSSYNVEAHTVPTTAEVKTYLGSVELDIENGPLFSIDLFDVTDGSAQQAIALSAHPLIADAASMRIIAQDLRELLKGNTVFADRDASFLSTLSMEEAVIDIDTPTFDLANWGLKDAKQLSKNLIKNSITLPSGTTSLLLGAANKALSTQPADILMTVLANVWSTVFERCVSIAIKDESRTDRAVGQYSRIRQLPEANIDEFIQLLGRVKDYRVYEDLTPSLQAKLPDMVEMLVDSIDYTTTSGGEALQRPVVGPQAVLTVSAIVANGEMKINFTHSGDLAQQKTLATFINTVEQKLPTVTNMLSSMARKPTVSDFPLLHLDHSHIATLEKVLADIDIPYANVEAIVPCTPLQQRMLNSQKQTPGSYESETTIKITSGDRTEIDIPRLQAAWKDVTARHESLRTVFIPSVARTFESDQLVLKSYEPTVNVMECDNANLGRIITNHHTVLQSSYKPNVGFTLFQTPSALYSKLEISDTLQNGMTSHIICQDLALAYQDLLPEGTAPSFREYVQDIAEQDTKSSKDFWNNYLENAKPCHIARKNNAFEKGDNVSIPVHLNMSIEGLSQICHKQKITAATIFQAAWVMVLRSLAETDDVLFGYMTTNRELNIAEMDQLVGPMTNMFACHLNIAPDTSIVELLEQTRESFLETLEHQQGFLTAAAAKEELDGELPFNSVMSIEYTAEEETQTYFPGVGEVKADGLRFQTLASTKAPEFDVMLDVLLGEQSVDVQLGYWSGVVDKMVMQRAATMYKGVVEQLVEGEGMQGWVGGLRVLSP